ncbi:hypothetical protein AwDysgo_15930 [Bacteroidales bacterium]|nr:hypothetical protein AwDysgo_15930 [Bacteroidales bacterium]
MKITIYIFFLLNAAGLCAQDYETLIALSFEYVQAENLNAAKQVLIEALRLEPANARNVLLLSNLGTLQRQTGENKDALLSYTAALSRAPTSTSILANRARLFVELNQAQDAIMDYTMLLQLLPHDNETYYQRGLLYLQTKNIEAAQADFEHLLAANENTLQGRLGMAKVAIFRNEYEDAEKIYYFLIEKLPQLSDLYVGRAELYLLMGKNAAALRDVNKAMSLKEKDKEDPDAYLYELRALCKEQIFEYKDAEKDREQANKIKNLQ